MAATASLDRDVIFRYSTANVILSLFFFLTHARIAAEPAKSQHWDRGRKFSNSAKGGFSKMSF